MQNIWFTSDDHFAHARICELEKRPFGTPILPTDTEGERRAKAFANCSIMDKAIIDNWNAFVGKKDIIYHLGDFCFYDPDKYLDQLNGTIHLVRGNHDEKSTEKAKKRFASYGDMLYIKCRGYKIHCTHYKMTSWRSSHHGSWHLFGHSHGQLGSHLTTGKCLDVGVMNKKWAPGIPWLYSFEEIEKFMATRPLTIHHEFDTITYDI